MAEWAARRFWSDVSVHPTAAGYGVRLDDRPVRTPAKALLEVPTRAYAEAVAGEWAGQGERIDPLSMPFTRTANSAIDNVAQNRGEIATIVAAYAETDLLCYRAERPAELIARQAADWDPLLDMAAERFGARLVTCSGVMHVAQPPDAVAALAAQVAALDAFRLAALHDLVALSGSLVLGLAGLHGIRPPEALWTLSRIDEDWQAEHWGRDEEADAIAARKRVDFLHAAHVLAKLDEK